MSDKPPSGAPPSYDVATGSSASSKPTTSSHLEVPGARHGIPAAHRRSMEDEHRPLPEGWLRQYDAKEQHQFFVDSRANPPRSIWHHPYDDDVYLKSLTSEQRERLQEDERERMAYPQDHSEDESHSPKAAKNTGGSSYSQELPPRPSGSHDPHGKVSFGEKIKQKVTGQTKEERAEAKRRQEQEERQYYEAHMKFRQAQQRAEMTGQPQFFAKDRDGKEIFIEPPNMGGYGPGSSGLYGNNGYGYNPYTSGPYANPNARFIRPSNPYNRPYGSMYGGGLGMPLMGGMMGGMLLGGLLF